MALPRSASRELRHLCGGAGEGLNQGACDALGQTDQDHLSTVEGGDGMMNQGQRVISMAALAGLLGALVLAGCATKNVAVTTAGNPTTPGQAETKAAANTPFKGSSKTPVDDNIATPQTMAVA